MMPWAAGTAIVKTMATMAKPIINSTSVTPFCKVLDINEMFALFKDTPNVICLFTELKNLVIGEYNNLFKLILGIQLHIKVSEKINL
ncbi:hypothetical protein NBRC116595_16070 [Aliiglaciecola sp. NS0011-25]